MSQCCMSQHLMSQDCISQCCTSKASYVPGLHIPALCVLVLHVKASQVLDFHALASHVPVLRVPVLHLPASHIPGLHIPALPVLVLHLQALPVLLTLHIPTLPVPTSLVLMLHVPVRWHGVAACSSLLDSKAQAWQPSASHFGREKVCLGPKLPLFQVKHYRQVVFPLGVESLHAGFSLCLRMLQPRDDPAGITGAGKKIHAMPAAGHFIPIPKKPMGELENIQRSMPLAHPCLSIPPMPPPSLGAAWGRWWGTMTPNRLSPHHPLFQPEFPGLCKASGLGKPERSPAAAPTEPPQSSSLPACLHSCRITDSSPFPLPPPLQPFFPKIHPKTLSGEKGKAKHWDSKWGFAGCLTKIFARVLDAAVLQHPKILALSSITGSFRIKSAKFGS